MNILAAIGVIAAVAAVIGFLLSAILEPGTPLHQAAAYPTVFGAIIAVLGFGASGILRGN